jgi:2-dehydro-3-deoxyphosphooctonate aldolase (KDO 8-P synthase)
MIPLVNEFDFLQGKKAGGQNPFFLIAGPCVIENDQLLEQVAKELKKLKDNLNLCILFKSSYDKANRSNIQSFRGPGIREGLKSLKRIKDQFDLPLLTDIHSPEEAEIASEFCDMLQIPAFLSRQTDLLIAAARTGRWLNVKKGQFMAPMDALQVVDKCRQAGNSKVTICERGYTFGYNNLVVDMRGIEQLRREGVPVVLDATHATQLPGGGVQSGGQREMAFPLARAAAAVGIDGLFMETHPNPIDAKSDSTNQVFLKDFLSYIPKLLSIDELVKERRLLKKT